VKQEPSQVTAGIPALQGGEDVNWLLFSIAVAVMACVLAVFAPGHGPRGLWVIIVALSWFATGLSLAPFRPRRAVVLNSPADTEVATPRAEPPA
jgi:hypothetical protein